ncbi:hypothetical protein [Streptomyces sp. NPDC056723]|uniref:hypothetical protein n=1 Tax=Streptomyces sp. NPDC056723 TaxID=3345925 RepID=UPI0036AD3389
MLIARELLAQLVESDCLRLPANRAEPGGAAQLLLAAHTRRDGRLGCLGDGGLDLDQIAAFCTLTSQQAGEHAELTLAADWLADIAVDTGQGRLRGQLTECVLSLSGLMQTAGMWPPGSLMIDVRRARGGAFAGG